MTPRDFCYWLQGYFEIEMPKGDVLIGQWNTIIEHLTLTVNSGMFSDEDSFNSYVDNLWGFIQINGLQTPGEEQWKHIQKTLAGLFEKVTSKPEEPSLDAEELLEKIREKRQEHIQPYPLTHDVPICSAEPPGHNDAYCMSAERSYPLHKDDRLGRNPLK